MKEKNPERIFSVVIFSLLNVLFLLTHFTLWGMIPLGLTVGYYLLCALPKKNCTVSDLFGAFIGAFAADMLAVLFCQWVAMCVQNGVSMAPGPIRGGQMAGLINLLIFAVIFLCIFNKQDNSIRLGFVITRYIVLFAVTLGGTFISVRWTDIKVIFALGAILFFAALIEAFTGRKNDYTKNKVFSWMLSVMLAFTVLSALYGDFCVFVMQKITTLSFLDLDKWYIMAAALVLLFVGFIETLCLRKPSRDVVAAQSGSIDTQVYLMLFFGVLYLLALSANRTPYDGILILVYLLANAVYIFVGEKKKRTMLFKGAVSQENFYYGATLALLLLLPAAFAHGHLLQYMILTALALFVLMRGINADIETEKEKAWQTRSFWQTVLTFLAIYSAVEVTMKGRNIKAYFLIGFIYLLTTLAMCFISIPNKKDKKNHSGMRYIIMIPVVLIFLFAVPKTDIRVKYQANDTLAVSQNVSASSVGETEEVRVTVSVKKNGVRPETAYAYWMHDKEMIPLEIGDKENTIPLQNDCLCVVCKGEDGTVYTNYRWFYRTDLQEDDRVGVSRYR